MNLTRRTFMGSILALGVAPAVARSSSLMRVTDLSRRWTYTPLLMVGCDDLTEHIIQTGNKNAYSYSTSFDVASMDNSLKIVRVFANGEEIYPSSVRGRVISFKDLDLSPYGFVIPEIVGSY